MSDDPRRSGLLLPIASLPGPFGIGDIGPASWRFAETLRRSGQSVWEVLPLHPSAARFSPYEPASAFAGDPLLISPELLVEDGLLRPQDIATPPPFPTDRVDVAAVSAFKRDLLKKAHGNFLRDAGQRDWDDYRSFLVANAEWLQDYALFSALKDQFSGASWLSWPAEWRDRRFRFGADGAKALGEAAAFQEFLQYLFEKQWTRLRRETAARGIEILGDIPLYVSLESADVWAHRDHFLLDADGRPTALSGVPPDCFNATGQLWGTPLFDWDSLRRQGYEWWLHRLERAERLFDWARLDHFIGYVRFWEVPAQDKVATRGAWRKGPGADFLAAALARTARLKLVAENLGVVTPAVEALRRRFGLPGTRVVVFDAKNPAGKLPSYPENTVVMTSTHDTPTLTAWMRSRGRGSGARPEDASRRWPIIEQALRSKARLVVSPIQDILGLGDEARINRPGVAEGNWTWRLAPGALDDESLRRLRELTEESGRSPKGQGAEVRDEL